MTGKTKALARAGLMAALGFVFLFLASVAPSGRLALAALAGILAAFVRMDAGTTWGIICFMATALLALLLLPVKSVALVYALFFGYYPIVKYSFERLRAPVLRWLCKLAVFNAALCLLLYLATLAVAGVLLAGGEVPELIAAAEQWALPALVLAGNAVFVVYDLAMTKAILFYLRRFAGKLK